MSLAEAETVEQSRRDRILAGAMQVFLAYGFQRTTMDDIARAAEISRPALYLLFRNKTDIYRALAEDFVTGTIAHARSALDEAAGVEVRIAGALDCALCMMAEIEQSPHGAEILDMKNSLAADIVADARAQLVAMLEDTIADEARRCDLDLSKQGLSPGLLAGMALDAIDGLKLRNLAQDEQRELATAYIGVVTAPLRTAG